MSWKLTELNEDNLGGILDDLLKVFSDQDFDGTAVPVLGDVLCVQVRLWGVEEEEEEEGADDDELCQLKLKPSNTIC